ncbi:MAG: folate family ECF transporter S component [Clostridia bacterium]|nr:folate family ECF transporter S component [Clostridia bacterium]
MKLKKVTCTQCGAALSANEMDSSLQCEYCGTAFSVEKSVPTAKNTSSAAMPLRMMVVIALLIAIYVVLDRIVPSVKLPGAKIGFSFVAPFVAAMLYGPIAAMLVYGLGDFVAALLFPFGTYHVGFTLVAAVMGIILGLFLHEKPLEAFGIDKLRGKIKLFPNIIIPVLINCLILGLLVNTIWVSQLYGSKTYLGWFVYRLTEYAILVPAQIIIAPMLLKLCEQLKKAGIGSTSFSKKRSKA